MLTLTLYQHPTDKRAMDKQLYEAISEAIDNGFKVKLIDAVKTACESLNCDFIRKESYQHYVIAVNLV